MRERTVGDYVADGVMVLVALMLVGLVVIFIGAVVGFVPTEDPRQCTVEVGGTGKTHGEDWKLTGTWRYGDEVYRCVDGEHR